jgi:hypothetical protein
MSKKYASGSPPAFHFGGQAIPDTTPTCRHDGHPDGGKEVQNNLKTTVEANIGGWRL